MAEVRLDPVGIVLGIEMSQLARSSREGYPLLEVCALFSTLIGDVDGSYDPDEQAQAVIALIVEVFVRRGTINAVLPHRVEHELQRPHRVSRGPRKGVALVPSQPGDVE
jgi:hypothetical protein